MGALSVDAAWSILSPEAGDRIDEARLRHQARTFFDAEVAVLGDEVAVGARGGAPTRLRVHSVDLHDAPEVRAEADRAVLAIGGAGFDALIARARRVFQIARDVESGDPRAPLLLAAILSSVYLAPILPPGGGTIFGTRGARVRLEQAGWPGQSPA